MTGDLHHVVVVEIQPGHRVVGTRMRRFLLDRHRFARRIELHHTEPLRIAHIVAEHRGAGLARHRLLQENAQVRAVKDVVTEHQGNRITADEVRPDQKRLRQPVGRRLHRIGEPDAEPGTISEQPPEVRLILRRGDDQNVANLRQHQRRKRIVDHRLVIDAEQLLRNSAGDRMEPTPGSAGQNNAFHFAFPPSPRRSRE